MRSVLIQLGPWGLGALPILWLAAFAFVFLWQRLENGKAQQPTKAPDLPGSALVSLAVALVMFSLVNYFAPLSIKAYGVMMLVAFAAGTLWAAYSATERDLKSAAIIDVALGMLIGGIVGSRIVYVLLNLQRFSTIGEMFDVWSGGLSFHGGVAGAALATYLYCRYHGHNFFRLTDQCAPAAALGYSFARIGCFLNGCCHGVPTDLPWAVTFPATGACTTPGVPIHPTQLYASALSLLIFAVLVYLKPRVKRPGHLFLGYLMLYSVMRFGVEFTRAGATARYLTEGFFMTEAQLASIIIFVLSAIILITTWPRQPHDKQ